MYNLYFTDENYNKDKETSKKLIEDLQKKLIIKTY